MFGRNKFVFRKKDFAMLKELNDLVINRGEDFVKLAKDRENLIIDLFKEFKRTGEISKHHLDSLSVLIEDERALVIDFEKRFEDAKPLFMNLFETAPASLRKCAEDQAWAFKFASHSLCKKLAEVYPILHKLVILFMDYLRHLKHRSLLEEKLIARDLTVLLSRHSELRQLWAKDKEIFVDFKTYFAELKSASESVKASKSSFIGVASTGIFLSVTYLHFFSSTNDPDSGVAFFSSIIFLLILIYNLAVYLSSAEKYELIAEKKLDYFPKGVHFSD